MNQDVVVRLRLDTGNVPQASQQTAQAIAGIGKAGEVSARQTAAAMRTLPAQFTDIATQLAGGQNPLLILLQQGGQIKDSFGGIGPAIRAVGSAISPVTVAVGGLAAAAGLLATGLYQGYKESNRIRDTLALTGNAAGLTADRFNALAARVSAASEQTVGSAREVALALASTGRTSAGLIESQAKAAARIADLSGESATKIAGTFAQQLKAPARFAAELNETYNFLTVAQFKRIQQLEREGRAVDAAVLTNDLLLKNYEKQRTELGLLERTLNGAAKEFSAFWAAVKGFGAPETTQQQIARLRKEVQQILDASGGREPSAGNFSAGRIGQLRARLALLAEQAKQENAAAEEASRAAQANRTGIADALGTDQPAALGAIRTAREQYRADFLRSEKEFYGELEKLRKKEAEDAGKDPLGEFITKRVLPADQERADRRLAAEKEFLQELRDSTRRAGIELIADEQKRGEALIALDLEIANRRLGAKGLSESGLAEARALNAKKADNELRAYTGRLGASTYDDVRGALAAAFRDSNNPVKAFANALGNAVFTRVSTRLADALATAAVGRDGQGGLWGDLLSLVGSVAGGGYTVDASGAGINAPDVNGTRGGMATGTNFVPRDMFALLHRGEAVVPAKYNPHAGGGHGGREMHIHYHVPAGETPASYAAALERHAARVKADLVADAARPGRAMNNALQLGVT